MPVELLLLFCFVGAGVLMCVAILTINIAMAQRARQLAAQADEGEWDEQDGWGEYDDGPLPEQREQEEAEGDGEEQPPVQLPPVRPEPPQPIFSPLDLPEAGAVLGSLRLQVDNAQAQGARAEQQDAFAITPLEEARVLQSHGVMAVVCDGMGGLEGGARAANTAAVQFMRAYLEGGAPDAEALHEALDQANDRVYELASGLEGRLGTTLVAAAVSRKGLWFISVGDSHIYLHRKGKLYQLNRDHNYYAELLEQVEQGKITLEEARRHPERAHLTSFLGQKTPALVDANAEPLALRPGDRVLLCSDGLFKTLPARTMQEILTQERESAAQALVDAALEVNKPRQDNVTAVVLYLDQL